MKKTIINLCLLLLISATVQAQNYITVGNSAEHPAQYQTAQEAHDAANPGDILLFHGSSASYGNMTVTKPLTIMGPGYFLGQNVDQQVNLQTANIGNIYFNDGAEGSLVYGMNVGYVRVNCSDIIIERNDIGQVRVNESPGDIASLSEVIITSNYVGGSVTLWSNASNVVASNNYIGGIGSYSNTDFLVVNNNVIVGGITTYNALFSNNIFRSSSSHYTAPSYNNIFQHNIAAGTLVSGNGNIENVDMSTVFVGYPTQGDYSNDARYQLIDDSSNPAKGGGINGVDCGMFGGPDPYILSGIPSIPYIYSIIMPVHTDANGNIPVEVKARTNN